MLPPSPPPPPPPILSDLLDHASPSESLLTKSGLTTLQRGRQAAEICPDKSPPCHPQVGLIMGAVVEANRLVDQLRARLRGIVAAVCQASHPRTLVLQGLKPFTLGAATSGARSYVHLCLLAIHAALLHQLA